MATVYMSYRSTEEPFVRYSAHGRHEYVNLTLRRFS